jgi:hypothetical protein
MRTLGVICLGLIFSTAARGQDDPDLPDLPDLQTAQNTQPSQNPQNPATGQQPASHPAAATTYSSGYEVRLKIHKYTSYATLPLFAATFALGQSLYNDPANDSRKGIHAALGTGLVGLFGVNSVTGVWNLWEGRHDPDGRTVRIVHGVLMLAASGGFVAASATAPSTKQGIEVFNADRSTHRNIAVASIGVGTAGYLLMLFKGH